MTQEVSSRAGPQSSVRTSFPSAGGPLPGSGRGTGSPWHTEAVKYQECMESGTGGRELTPVSVDLHRWSLSCTRELEDPHLPWRYFLLQNPPGTNSQGTDSIPSMQAAQQGDIGQEGWGCVCAIHSTLKICPCQELPPLTHLLPGTLGHTGGFSMKCKGCDPGKIRAEPTPLPYPPQCYPERQWFHVVVLYLNVKT